MGTGKLVYFNKVDGGKVPGKQKPDWCNVFRGGDDDVDPNSLHTLGDIKAGGYFLLAVIKDSNKVLNVQHPVDAYEKDHADLNFDTVEIDFDDIHGGPSKIFAMTGSKANAVWLIEDVDDDLDDTVEAPPAVNLFGQEEDAKLPANED